MGGARFSFPQKQELGLQQGKSLDQQAKEAEDLAKWNKIELEKVKKARADKEAELLAMDEEKEAEARAKEDALFVTWMEKEEDFHMEQARMRSAIRIQDGRAKPIDILANYIAKANDRTDLDSDVREPYAIFAGLNLQDCEDLFADIKVYEELGKQKEQATGIDANPQFWDDMKIIAEYEMKERTRDAVQNSKTKNAAERRAVDTGINPKVQIQIKTMFRGKTHPQLVAMAQQVGERLKSGFDATGGAIDVTYWESLANELKCEVAKASLRAQHQDMLERKLDILRQKSQAEGSADDDGDVSDGDIIFDEADLEAIGEEEEDEDNVLADYAPEPPLIVDGAEDDEFDEDEEEVVIDPEEDAAQLLKHRQTILFGPKSKASWKAASLPGARTDTASDSMTAADKEFMRSQDRQKLGKDEESFNTDVSLSNPMDYVWRDKYKPRKPRFFNRVHTGFEWNKYNQTHYDSDNPPPKIVQGYKFNIFYPDLVKRREIPQYELSPLPDEPGFAILKFKAGPPYEDLAFKVVNKQWEMGRQRGFRSQFQHNVLQVWFHFRRERYRR